MYSEYFKLNKTPGGVFVDALVVIFSLSGFMWKIIKP